MQKNRTVKLFGEIFLKNRIKHRYFYYITKNKKRKNNGRAQKRSLSLSFGIVNLFLFRDDFQHSAGHEIFIGSGIQIKQPALG
jgi:hypothetical protein